MEKKSQKTAESKLSEKEINFCILKYQDKLKDEAIASEVGISARTVYEWIKRPEIQEEITRLGKADTQRAVMLFQRNARRAAQATLGLLEKEEVKNKKGKVVGKIFIQPGEVVRKAAADILQSININIKGPESETSSLDDLLGDVDNGDIARRAKKLLDRAKRKP